MIFDIEKYGFDMFYETGVEECTWIFPKEASIGKWNYIISTPGQTYKSLAKSNENPVYRIYNLDSNKVIYLGEIPSDEYASELFKNLRMQHLPYVRRDMNIENILNKH